MTVNILTHDDLQRFKTELLDELKALLKDAAQPPKQWLKSDEVRKILKLSASTLQTLRINGTLQYTKLGGIIYYDYDHIQKTFRDNLRRANK